MKAREILRDALPFALVLAVQAGIGAVAAAIDARNGFRSPDALYVAALQAFVGACYLAARLAARARERAAVRRAARRPLDAGLPELGSFPSPTSAAWLEYAENLRSEAFRALAARDAASREELDAFVAAVHEMKTPAAALSLLAEAAERDGRPLRPLDVKLEAEELDRLLELTLGRVRLADFERDSAVEVLSLRAAAASSVKRARRIFIARGVSVEFADGDAEARTDGKWAAFVLDQLIVNAAKYARSRVVVRVVGGAGGAGDAAAIVEDDGPGIRAEDAARLFSPSFTGSAGRSAEASGLPATGYGLYLAARAASALGARLSLVPAAGGGTRASLEFPPGAGGPSGAPGPGDLAPT